MATQLSNQLSKNQNWKSSGKRNVMLPTLDPILSRYPRRIRNSEWWRKQSNRTGVRESTAETGDSCAGHIKSMLWTRRKASTEEIWTYVKAQRCQASRNPVLAASAANISVIGRHPFICPQSSPYAAPSYNFCQRFKN